MEREREREDKRTYAGYETFCVFTNLVLSLLLGEHHMIRKFLSDFSKY